MLRMSLNSLLERLEDNRNKDGTRKSLPTANLITFYVKHQHRVTVAAAARPTKLCGGPGGFHGYQEQSSLSDATLNQF